MKPIFPLLLAAFPATAQDLSPAIARMQAAMAAEDLLSTCPADLYRSRMPLLSRIFGPGADLPDGFCAAGPEGCVSACLDGLSGDACFRFGHLMETAKGGDALTGRHAHALGCALGDPSGCTNRGGGIRNLPLTGDALSLVPFEDKHDCLFRSFSLACHAANSWGCAMLGQAYENGEGTAVSTDLAITSYTAACTLSAPDTEFPACLFARARLDELARAP